MIYGRNMVLLFVEVLRGWRVFAACANLVTVVTRRSAGPAVRSLVDGLRGKRERFTRCTTSEQPAQKADSPRERPPQPTRRP